MRRADDRPLHAVPRESSELLLSGEPTALRSDAGGHDREWLPVEALQRLRLFEDGRQLREIGMVSSKLARRRGERSCLATRVVRQRRELTSSRQPGKTRTAERRHD